MSGISRGIADQVLQAFTPRHTEAVPEGARINVHAAVSRFSVLYERIRNAVDYKDEHLLRKAAILRILKRQLILERDPQTVAWNLVRELIGAKYLPNGELSESVVDEVAIRVKKYQTISRCRSGSSAHDAWLVALISVELEELLVDSMTEKALVTFLYERVADRVQVTGKAVQDTDARLQTYLACYRAYLKADDEVLGYKLLRAYMPEWLRPDEWMSQPQPVADRLIGVERRIKRTLRDPLGSRFLRAVKPWAVALTVLRDVLVEKPAQASDVMTNVEALRPEITTVTEKRYKDAAGRLRRGAIRATLYLFFTKMVFAFIIEVPIEMYWLGHVALPALATNLLFPPFLMFFIGMLLRVPGKDNTQKMIANVETLLDATPLPMKEIRLPRERGWLSKTIFSLVYASMFIVIFGGATTILFSLGFTWVSVAIFLFFLCLVSFFGFRLRGTAREFVVVEPKHGVTAVFTDFVSLPILRAGKFLSRGISRLNVFLFFFDFLFEAPFKIFLTVLEEWFSFLKEKRKNCNNVHVEFHVQDIPRTTRGFETPHGDLQTPFFMPIATKGAVKTISTVDVERVGSPILLSNTYHLYLRPGVDVMRSFGGLHAFMSWNGALLTDSGGYQVFSLAKTRKITEEGAVFASHIDGSRHLLTPELSMEIQQVIGSDVAMVLDECTPAGSGPEYLIPSIERTTRWAERSKIAFEKGRETSNNKGAQLFGINQGGTDEGLRLRHAESLKKIGFDGYAIGGLSVGEPFDDACRTVAALDTVLPSDRPRYFMGGAKPHEIVEYVKRGVDMFDCVLPTRNARHGLLYRFIHDDLSRPDFYEAVHVTNETLRMSDEPLVAGSPPSEGDFGELSRTGVGGGSVIDPITEELSRYSLGYVRHLFTVEEVLGQRLLTLANVRFYVELMKRIRLAIEAGTL